MKYCSNCDCELPDKLGPGVFLIWTADETLILCADCFRVRRMLQEMADESYATD